MKKNHIKILKADEGMYLYNGEDVCTMVTLLENDDDTQWREITKEEGDLIEQQKAEKEQLEQQRQLEENDNINN